MNRVFFQRTPLFLLIATFCSFSTTSGFKPLPEVETNIQNFFVKNTTKKEQHNMKITPIDVLGESANYAYLVIDEHSKEAAAVDPADPEKVISAAQKEGVKITTILTTHHHWDHADGNPGMCEKIPGLKVVGADDRIPKLNHKVKDGDKFNIGQLEVLVRFVPCHTTGHVYYIVKGGQHQPLALFSGDTLFIAGCGKFFEGTAEQMRYALMEVAAKLPGDTQVWCGHEYTVGNLKFALSVDPNNKILQDKLEWAQKKKTSYRIYNTLNYQR